MTPDLSVLSLLACAAALAGAGVYFSIPLLMPLFRRYAMARTSARGSHRIPTPQGGGLPIVVAVVLLSLVAGLAGAFSGLPAELRQYYVLSLFAAVAMALLGAADDMRPMPALTRFIIQTILATVVVFGAPATWHIVTIVPQVIERMVLVVGFVWMVNLTNFMDGIDGIVVVETVPLGATLALIATFGLLSVEAGLIAAALAGATAGFYRYNRHPAQLFLGDVGSLSIGFLIAALLFELAATQGLIAALLPPLYFLADATFTLLIGLIARLDVTKPHRRHAYQRAVDSGWSAPQVTRVVLTLNLALALLSCLAVIGSDGWDAPCLVVGMIATGFVIRVFRSGAE